MGHHYGKTLKDGYLGKAPVPRRGGWLVTKGRVRLDSTAVSIFVDILVGLTNTVSEAKIQISLLIVIVRCLVYVRWAMGKHLFHVGGWLVTNFST